jgi:hypothetical protein
MIKVDWDSSYTNAGNVDVIARAFQIALLAYFEQQNIDHECSISIDRIKNDQGKNKDIITISKNYD